MVAQAADGVHVAAQQALQRARVQVQHLQGTHPYTLKNPGTHQWLANSDC